MDYVTDRRKFTLQYLRDGRLIQRDREVHSGAYTLRGTRLTVRWLRMRFHSGESIKAIAADYGLSPKVVRFAVREWGEAIDD